MMNSLWTLENIHNVYFHTYRVYMFGCVSNTKHVYGLIPSRNSSMQTAL